MTVRALVPVGIIVVFLMTAFCPPYKLILQSTPAHLSS